MNENSINLNESTVDDLVRVSGMDADTAQRIIDYRNVHGDFRSFEDLRGVPGFTSDWLDEYRDRFVF